MVNSGIRRLVTSRFRARRNSSGALTWARRPRPLLVLSTTALLVGAMAASCLPVPANNLVPNPSFEGGAGGWSTWQSALTRVHLGAAAPSGAWVARVSHASGNAYSIYSDPGQVPVASGVAGTTYTASAWVAAASPSAIGKPATITLRESAPGVGAQVKLNTSAAVRLTNRFQEVRVQGTVERSRDAMDIYVRQDGAASGNAFDVDLITLQRDGGARPTPTPPGRTPTPRPTATPTPGQCLNQGNPTLGAHEPWTLRIDNPCITVSGYVTETGQEGDEDWTIEQLCLDPQFNYLATSANDHSLCSGGRLALHLETFTQACLNYPADSCADAGHFHAPLPLPAAGRHVEVTGVLVGDLNHPVNGVAWHEIHPFWSLKTLP